MGASQSTEAEQADSGQAPPNWWECCGARSNKVARGQAKAVGGKLSARAFEKDPPAPGTSAGSAAPALPKPVIVEADLPDTSDIERIQSKRPTLRAAAPAPGPPPPEAPGDKTEAETKEAGVGLLFNRGAGNQGWAVKTAIKGSPAEASGQISEDDVLVSVDGKPVDEVASLGELSNMLMGAEGVPIKLVFSRQGVARDVSLVRSTSWMGEDGRKINKQNIRKFGTWEATRTDFRTDSDEKPVAEEQPDSVDL